MYEIGCSVKNKSRLGHKSSKTGKETGDRFGGSSDLDNLALLSSSVNLSKYKKLENQ